MIQRTTMALFLLAACLRTAAQVTVEVVLEQEQFLPSESIVAAVRVTNYSGQTLRLGQDDDWLRFGVEGSDGFVVEQVGQVPVKTPFDVESGRVGIRRVNITPYFRVSRPGRYTLQASAHILELSQTIPSKPVHFDVIAGTKLWEQAVGVPRTGSRSNAPVELRKFTLQQAIYLKEMRLYLRLTDAAESVVYRVFPLGPMVSFSRPEAQVDRESRLHVFYQTGARVFLYAVVGPDGELQVRQTHEMTASRPSLKVNDQGVIYVAGGARRVTLGDLPGPSPAGTNSPASPKVPESPANR